jgi:outer membrane lipoprotein SlyB
MKNRIALAAALAVAMAGAACGGGGSSPSASPVAQAPVAQPVPRVASAGQPASAAHTPVAAVCHDCATVEEVHAVKHKGEGGAVGMIGGAVVGGLLGHQVGGGKGKTLATVGGAAAGAYAGNEVQKQVSSKTVWVTKVKMKDGSTQTFEQEVEPVWKAGQSVRVKDGALKSI